MTTARPVSRPGPESMPARLGLKASVVTRRTGLILTADVGIDEWRRIGEQIFLLADSSAWWLGDWLVFGQDRYPDRYRRMIDRTGLEYQTLRNYAWVARRFSMSRRRDRLPFQHHADVAALPEPEQDRLLDQAQRSNWSRNELRRQIRAVRGVQLPVPGPAPIQLSVDSGQRQRWQVAADRSGLVLGEWMASALDAAAQAATLERPPIAGG